LTLANSDIKRDSLKRNDLGGPNEYQTAYYKRRVGYIKLQPHDDLEKDQVW